MNVKWLIETYEGSIENFDDLYHCVKRMGDEITVLPWKPFLEIAELPYKDDDCVISIGTIGFIDRIQRTKPWIPGCFATFRNYECTTYYNYFGNYLLNNNYVMLPLGEVERRYVWLQEIFKTGSLFIRPSNGRKSFTGQILRDLKDLQVLNNVSKETLCVIAPKYNLGCEFRYFVSGSNILDGSMYYDSFGIHKTENIDILVGADMKQEISCRNLIDEILQNRTWEPDAIYCIDACWNNDLNRPQIMEIGAISTSGWYAIRPEKVVPYMRKMAIKEWHEYNGTANYN